MDHFATPFGNISLQRLPVTNNSPLRAWDAADEYLLNYLHENRWLSLSESKLLVVNDQFGALTTVLHEYAAESWSDSYQSHLATQLNLQNNQFADNTLYTPSTQIPVQIPDLVIIKIPKTLALLEDQLIKLKAVISTETRIIAGGMAKYIHTSTLDIFEKILGTTRTSLAVKKARLIFPHNKKNEHLAPPYPKSFFDRDWNITLTNHANVFAKEKLDIGARFMLEQFEKLPPAKHIIDLGCGNGVLGVIAKRQLLKNQHNNLQTTFVDESYMAIASAKENYHDAFGNTDQANFIVSDVLANVVDKADLILCNPPFHQQHAIGDQIAWEMFRQSHQQLQKGGELWVVANRHLNYHIKLKRLFGNYTNLAGNKKFVVITAKK
jgi:23S rRNA (guanine1835-N2)-methyltransferase